MTTIQFTKINDPYGEYIYYTIEECYRRNGYRHLERAIAYTSAGYPDRFYEGSMRKALRNFKKADELKIPEYLEPMLDLFTKRIVDSIMIMLGK